MSNKIIIFCIVIVVIMIIWGYFRLVFLLEQYLSTKLNFVIPFFIQFFIVFMLLFYIIGLIFRIIGNIVGDPIPVYSNSISNREIIQKEARGFYSFVFEKEEYLEKLDGSTLNVRIESASRNSRLLRYDIMSDAIYSLPVMLEKNGNITSLVPIGIYDEIKELFSDDGEFFNIMGFLNEFFQLEGAEESSYHLYVLDIEGILKFHNYWVEI